MIRGLIVVTAFVAVTGAWLVDRTKIHELRAELTRADKQEDLLERTFMTTPAIVGRPVSDYPNLQLLVDRVIVPSDDYFRTALNWVTYPDVLDSCENCEIYWFDLKSSGVEGDPFDFYMLVTDGVITRIQPGESFAW